MTRYLFASHDGFGLGHTRRNTLIAEQLLQDPMAEVVIMTGVACRPTWPLSDRLRLVEMPPLLKDSDGAYRHASLPFDEAIMERARLFSAVVREFAPTAVVVDRHPFGIAGELREGLEAARRHGASVVLGLRDVLDEPKAVRAELGGRGWAGVDQVFDALLVYGESWLCDHERDYELPMKPIYCGWVVEEVAPMPRDLSHLIVAAGGGGDGKEVFRIGVELVSAMRDTRVTLVAGPYGARPPLDTITHDPSVRARLSVLADVPSCAQLVAGAAGVVQMAGYNSTFESLAAGIRPVLVPRRSPRREQAIRASRLAAVGLADMVDETSAADEVAWLLRRDRRVTRAVLEDAGLRLDGASRAAAVIAARVAVAT